MSSSAHGRRPLFVVLVALGLVAFIEAAAFAAGKFLQSRYKMYAVPVLAPSDRVRTYADYLRLRDPRLGWPFLDEFGGDFYDASGARWSPAFRDPARFANRVSIFGDSYAAGIEVDHDHTWGNQLALSLGSRVGIFGVPGYGTDQSYLRFLELAGDPSRVVILTHLSEDITRNLTRNWDLFTRYRYYGLKPRFVLDARGELREVPLPRLSEREYLRVVGLESPPLALEHENFQPGGPAGVTRLEFPFALSIVRNLAGYQMRSTFARSPDYAEFYERGHAFQGLEITTRILEAFQAQARRRGQWPLVVLLPTRHDIRHVRRTGKWTYANLVDELRRAGVNHVDFGPTLLAHMGERDVRDFFKPLGHYDEAVSKLLADTVRETLEANGVTPPPSGTGARADTASRARIVPSSPLLGSGVVQTSYRLPGFPSESGRDAAKR